MIDIVEENPHSSSRELHKPRDADEVTKLHATEDRDRSKDAYTTYKDENIFSSEVSQLKIH